MHRSVVLVAVVAAVLVTTASYVTATRSTSEYYDESLQLSPFVDGKVHSEFKFTMTGYGDQPWQYEQHGSSSHYSGNNIRATHHTILPSALTSLVVQHGIASFDLTLSSGRWSPHWPTKSTPASGIQLTAWLEDEGDTQRRWNDFVAALGGLFCAGINTGMQGVEPGLPDWIKSDPRAQRDHGGTNPNLVLYHAVMPRLAATCTESLTPFLALTPCASRAGLTSLLNPHRLFDSEWTLIGVRFTRGSDGSRDNYVLTVGSVADPVRVHRLGGGLGQRDFSFKSLYDRELLKTCPVARSSVVSVTVPEHSVNPFQIEPKLGQVTLTRSNQSYVEWDVQKDSTSLPLDVSVTWPTENPFRYPLPSRMPRPPISVRRLLTGHGQERGRIGIELVNNLELPADVVWAEQWPWWMRGFVGTLRSTSTSMADVTAQTSLPARDLVRHLKYSPPISRQRPSTLQAIVSLPPRSTSRFELEYESSYLWYTEYPADAHRGLELAGAEVVLLRPAPASSGPTDANVNPARLLATRGEVLRLHTTSTLVSLPTPDFSMPYNVIILTSTVVALFFGSVVNALLRGWWVIDVGDNSIASEAKKKEKTS